MVEKDLASRSAREVLAWSFSFLALWLLLLIFSRGIFSFYDSYFSLRFPGWFLALSYLWIFIMAVELVLIWRNDIKGKFMDRSLAFFIAISAIFLIWLILLYVSYLAGFDSGSGHTFQVLGYVFGLIAFVLLALVAMVLFGWGIFKGWKAQ